MNPTLREQYQVPENATSDYLLGAMCGAQSGSYTTLWRITTNPTEVQPTQFMAGLLTGALNSRVRTRIRYVKKVLKVFENRFRITDLQVPCPTCGGSGKATHYLSGQPILSKDPCYMCKGTKTETRHHVTLR